MYVKASFVVCAMKDNGAAVRVRDLLGDGQPEANAFGFAGRKGFKETREDVGRRAGAVVEDAEDDLPVVDGLNGCNGTRSVPATVRFNPYLTAGPGSVGGVEDQVDEELAELARVGA